MGAVGASRLSPARQRAAGTPGFALSTRYSHAPGAHLVRGGRLRLMPEGPASLKDDRGASFRMAICTAPCANPRKDSPASGNGCCARPPSPASSGWPASVRCKPRTPIATARSTHPAPRTRVQTGECPTKWVPCKVREGNRAATSPSCAPHPHTGTRRCHALHASANPAQRHFRQFGRRSLTAYGPASSERRARRVVCGTAAQSC